jgi:DNA-binding MarR family transcriptional regulator
MGARGDDHIDEFIWALALVHRAMRTTIQRSLAERGIHAGQQFVLEALWNEDAVTCGELARRLGVALPTITKTITRMEAAGVVTRRPDTADARLVHVHLTERGRDLQADIETRLDEVAQRAFAGIDSAEKGRVMEVLARIRSNLGQGTLHAEPRGAAALVASRGDGG